MGKFPLLVRVTLCGRVSEVALVNPSWTFSLSAIRLENRSGVQVCSRTLGWHDSGSSRELGLNAGDFPQLWSGA